MNPARRAALLACAGSVFALFIALGSWQVKRLYWKLDLIERVEQRVHAPAVAAPGWDRWPQISAASDEYRHVRLTGTFLYALTAPVQASTELGSGFWLLTPLRCADGGVVLINRGFVRDRSHFADPAGSGAVTVTGLLRISEPGGAFLRHNDPIADRWYSRDVQAIAAARNLGSVAPYFVDADAVAANEAAERKSDTAAHDAPVGGLTVIAFRNDHLVYAITWYVLALMLAGACWWVALDERRAAQRQR